eukprot:CAMPEP_0183812806 /NCGR_PEP_ID=MMETSP0803_2-20130417/51851_1 /TAXON_ID=195967 /ORGANISM="Crustomastix stigmata, Strain CCMP3273" /LENGTH=63 /DNA_ID=CAMNT_0026057649 /DNA_START=108 /DNA_END=295 /DNA_ORIENTATION=+
MSASLAETTSICSLPCVDRSSAASSLRRLSTSDLSCDSSRSRALALVPGDAGPPAAAGLCAPP